MRWAATTRPGAAGCTNLASGTCPGVDRWRWPDDQIASAQGLTAFLTSALRTYPNASRRVLSLIGHGGGWSPPVPEGQPSGHGSQPGDPLGGMLWDRQPRSALSTPELGKALRDASSQTGQTFDLLFLDACSMAMAEVAYELRDSARYLLASANWKWAGFPYDKHLPSALGDGRTIGLAWLQNEVEHLRRWEGMPFTYALLDLSKAQTLRASTDLLASALMRAGGPLSSLAGRQQLLAASAAADRYDSNGDGAIRIGSSEQDADHYVDLGGFASQLAQRFESSDPATAQVAQAVASAVDQAVVVRAVQNGNPWLFPDQRWSWTPQASLSIYLPLHQGDWRLRYYRLIQFGSDGQWGAMINNYWQQRGTLALNYIPPAMPDCADDCPLPFGQLPLKHQTYLPLIANSNNPRLWRTITTP